MFMIFSFFSVYKEEDITYQNKIKWFYGWSGPILVSCDVLNHPELLLHTEKAAYTKTGKELTFFFI